MRLPDVTKVPPPLPSSSLGRSLTDLMQLQRQAEERRLKSRLEKREKKGTPKDEKPERKKKREGNSKKEEEETDSQEVLEADTEEDSQPEEEIPEGHFGVEAVLGTGTWKSKGRGGRGSRYWLIQFEGEDPATNEKWLPDWQPDSCVASTARSMLNAYKEAHSDWKEDTSRNEELRVVCEKEEESISN